jgi:hypothetical protein
MKRNNLITGGRRGAALVIALAASVVVMLSVVLLLGYISRMVGTQVELEERAQARLTEESAVLGLARLLREGRIEDINNLPEFTTGIMTTFFAVEEIQPTPPRELLIALDSYSYPLVLPSGTGLFIAGTRNGLIEIGLIDPFTGRMSPGFPVEVCDTPIYWDVAAGSIDGESVAFVLTREQNGDQIYCISSDGTVISTTSCVILWNGNSHLSVGEYDSEPALLVSDGGNLSQMIAPGSGTILYGSSASGTCPVFLEEGGLYGTFSTEPGFNILGLHVLDVFQGDFNRDGVSDIAWAGSTTFAFQSGTSSEPIVDAVPGGRLLAWGSLKGRFGLSACWLQRDGTKLWRRLSWIGFRDYSASGALNRDWSGRFDGSNNMMMGVMGDSISIVSMGMGYTRGICPAEDGLIGDIDGSTPDVISLESGDAALVMNPLDGDGLLLSTCTRTYRADRMITRNDWRFYIFGTGENRRIFIESESAGIR